MALRSAAGEPSVPGAPPVPHLKAILTRGFDRRLDIADIEVDVNRARLLYPNDPVVDYALALIHLKRMQNDAAADSFVAALKCDPTYLPARQGLLRIRIIQKDSKSLLAEVIDLATDVASPTADWRDAHHRAEAAALLGRVIGYLELPDIKLAGPTALGATRLEIEQTLGPTHVHLFSDGLADFTAEYCALEAINEQRAIDAMERQQWETGTAFDRLQKRSAEAARTTEALKISKRELQATADKERKDVDKQLKSLKDRHAEVSNSAKKVDDMIRQTRVDIARLETELDLRGFRGRELRLQPPLVQLQEELAGHQRTFADLESRAGELSGSIREAEAARDEVVERQELEKRHLARQIDTAEKRKQVVARRSQKVKKSARTEIRKREAKRQPVSVQQLFPLDLKAESTRLLQEMGIETPAAPQSASDE